MKIISLNKKTNSFFSGISLADLTNIALIAQKEWGIVSNDLRLIKYRENAIFQTTMIDGNKAVMRIHRPGYHGNQEILSELNWMRALTKSGILTPEVIPSLDGRDLVVLDIEWLSTPIQVDMLGWVDGELVGSLESDGLRIAKNRPLNIYRQIGSLLAKMHDHVESWNMPKSFVRHSWDMNSLLGSDPLWGKYWESPLLGKYQKDLVLDARKKASIELLSFDKSKKNYGLIHADLLPDNIFISKQNLLPIDFDDCGFGWHLFDLCTVTFFFYEENNFNEIEEAVLDGYTMQRTLYYNNPVNRELFYLLRGFTYLGWVHTRRDNDTSKEISSQVMSSACLIAQRYLNN